MSGSNVQGLLDELKASFENREYEKGERLLQQAINISREESKEFMRNLLMATEDPEKKGRILLAYYLNFI
jgi:hypothetical protein